MPQEKLQPEPEVYAIWAIFKKMNMKYLIPTNFTKPDDHVKLSLSPLAGPWKNHTREGP